MVVFEISDEDMPDNPPSGFKKVVVLQHPRLEINSSAGEEEIRHEAYLIWEKTGGSPDECWFEAKKKLGLE